MQALKSSSIFSVNFHLINSSLRSNSLILLLYYCSDSASSLSSSTPVSNRSLFKFLVKDLDFDETLALSLSNRYSSVKSVEKARSVANFFQSVGFSNAQIASSVRLQPPILFADVEKQLRPKIKFFQDLGLTESHLGKFFSKNSTLFSCSLDKKLIPFIKYMEKVVGNDNENIFKVFERCNGFLARDSISKLSSNIEYLKSCGIIGSQLSNLLMRQPRIFRMRESALRELVSRVIDMGFSTDSRMLVHGIHTINCISAETFKRKCELLKSFGFSDQDCITMFRKTPGVFRASEEKLRSGIYFFINVAKIDKNVLVKRGSLLMSSLEDRVIPRYRVLQLIKSKNLLKKERSFIYILELSEHKFLNFISRFPYDVEELLVAYKAHQYHSSSSSESEEMC